MRLFTIEKVKISQKKNMENGGVFFILKLTQRLFLIMVVWKKWIRNGFQHNFIIIMHFSQMKAGGSFGIGFNSNKSYIPDSVIKLIIWKYVVINKMQNGLLKMQQYLPQRIQ